MINTSTLTENLTQGEDIVIKTTQFVNEASDGSFGIMLVLSIYIIMFVVMIRFGVKTSLGTTSFVGFLLVLMLRLMEIVNDTIMYLSIIVVVISVMALWFTRDTGF